MSATLTKCVFVCEMLQKLPARSDAVSLDPELSGFCVESTCYLFEPLSNRARLGWQFARVEGFFLLPPHRPRGGISATVRSRLLSPVPYTLVHQRGVSCLAGEFGSQKGAPRAQPLGSGPRSHPPRERAAFFLVPSAVGATPTALIQLCQ